MFLAAPALSFVLLMMFVRRARRSNVPTGASREYHCRPPHPSPLPLGGAEGESLAAIGVHPRPRRGGEGWGEGESGDVVQMRPVPTGWGRLILGNALVLLCLVTPVLLAGETYFRFFYDTTDSLAYTRVSERWVQRHWHVNSAGCRDNVEYSPALEPGRHRISFVGDSFTAGHGIKDVEDRFANRLRRAHPDWEIHVLASVGLDTGGEVALMKKAFARGYQVDQVVLVYCLNDIGDLMPPQADVTGRVLAELDNSGWLFRDSYMLNLWHHHYTASRDPYLKDYCSFVREAYSGALWEQQKERLKAFRDLVACPRRPPGGGDFSFPACAGAQLRLPIRPRQTGPALAGARSAAA